MSKFKFGSSRSSKLRPWHEVTPLSYLNPTSFEFPEIVVSNIVSLNSSHRKITLHEFVVLKDDRFPLTYFCVSQIIKVYSSSNEHFIFAEVKRVLLIDL